MKKTLKSLVVIAFTFGAVLRLHSQGYIVPNGVITNYSRGSPGEISVVHDPTNYYYTGFFLHPTAPYPNTFSFDSIIDVGVRVFLVSQYDPISLQSIQSGSYTELLGLNNYTFNTGAAFYVGLYTGNQNFYPPDGIYSDPLFGWARLKNNNGTIELLNSALAFGAEGIYAGTQTLIPEPGVIGLFSLGLFLFGWHSRKRLKPQGS
jgi:hypothetical protein